MLMTRLYRLKNTFEVSYSCLRFSRETAFYSIGGSFNDVVSISEYIAPQRER
jgi:hypothetical protein